MWHLNLFSRARVKIILSLLKKNSGYGNIGKLLHVTCECESAEQMVALEPLVLILSALLKKKRVFGDMRIVRERRNLVCVSVDYGFHCSFFIYDDVHNSVIEQ